MKRVAKGLLGSALLCLSFAAQAEPQATAAPQANAAQQANASPQGNAAPAVAAGTPAGAVAPAAKAQPPRGKATDHVELDQTTITGNRELPNVMVIVPWKESGPAEPGKAGQSLLDEALQPLDREEFRRELKYQQALHGKAPAPKDSASTQLPKPTSP